jgi:phosphoribosylamine---glycine ligase
MSFPSSSSSQVNVLLVGSGGREHALAWKISQSPRLQRLFVAPGNAGTLEYNMPISSTDIRSLVDFAEKNSCFTIVGPEAPLGAGLVDELSREGLPVFGPTANAARLETSKVFAKELMKELDIPTADFRIFENYSAALEHAISIGGNLVIKADGLASGKGVFVCSNVSEAADALKAIFVDRVFGDSGNSVVVEEKLSGFEVSLFALCDGKRAVFLSTAMDHKKLLDGDLGPNTGGMGAFSPAINFEMSQIEQVMEEIVAPTVRRIGFKGFLYVGLMITNEGPKVLEFNVRSGDPETQCILPRLRFDILGTLLTIEKDGLSSLGSRPLTLSEEYSCSVVMCSRGYPTKAMETGFEIHGLAPAETLDRVNVFHSGTKLNEDGKILTAGGRVITVNGTGTTLKQASERAYAGVSLISWKGENHRSDIGRIANGRG